jgi:GT2 family glycosyltransferase
VVIVSGDMGPMTVDCVGCLSEPVVASMAVVDNAFGGPAGSQLAAADPRTTVIALERQHGFAAANNRGLPAGSAPFVLLLGSDILAPPGSIEALVAALQADAGAVSAGGRLVEPETLETQAQYRPRPFPTLANFVVILLGVEEA